MDPPLANWGNCPALRMPSEAVRQLGLREGSTVQAQLTLDRSTMPMSASMMDDLPSGARY